MTASLRRRLTSADRRVAAALRRRAGVSGRPKSTDEGFALIETVISISLIVLVMAAFSTFFVNTVAYTSLQRATQTATAIANSQLELIRALPASDLVNGRDLTSVTAQLAAAQLPTSPQSVVGALAGMAVGVGAAVDTLAVAGSGATALVPTTPITTTLNGIVYSTSVYLGNCSLSSGLVLGANCAVSLVSTGYLRVVVAVTWKGSRCPSTGCSYVTSTLINTAVDPLFSPTPSPPSAPTLTNPGNQTSAVGDVVAVTAVPTSVGASLITLTGVLPAGLFLNPVSGLISGSPVTVAPATPVTLTLTDAFGRTTSVSFTWTVIPGLTATAPPAQAGVIGSAMSPLTVSASGGTAPYTWADTGTTLPPGLSLATVADQAVITGTPTTFGTYPVTLRVTDAVGRISTVPFTWTIDYPPFAAANPGPQTSTVGVADSVVLTTTGGSGAFAWTSTSALPAGMTLTPAGLLSGTPTTAGTTTVNLVATDTRTRAARTVSFAFTVYSRPTITPPAAQQSAVGSAVSVQVGANCPNSPCTFRLNNGPATLGVSNTGLITGTITSSPQTFGAVTVTITDAGGASVTSGSFGWVVVSNLPSAPQTVTVTNSDGAVAVAWTAPATGAAVTGYTVTLAPGGATCATTGALGCTVSGLTNGTAYAVTVIATNSAGTGPASDAVRAIPYPTVMSAANGLSLWLDGADPTVFTTATGCTGPAATTTIGCWKDKSGLGQNVAQSTVAGRPTVGTWNGLPAASFNDTSDVLTATTNGTYQTVFVAANLTATGSQADWAYLFGQAGQDLTVRVGNGVNRAGPNGNDWSFNTSGTGAQFNWANGVPGANVYPPLAVITTDQSQSPRTMTPSVSSTFSNAGVARGLIGQIGDVITFNRVLTTAERLAVEEYLSRKWGVVRTVVPAAPQTVSVVNADSAVAVSWTAPGTGSAATGYTATLSPGGATCSTTTALNCSFSGLTNGTVYTVSVTANNAAGAGPASTARAIPYPAIMSAANGLSLWLDGADPSAFTAGSGCTGTGASTTIGCWKDKSGQGPNFLQATTANQPTVSTWNGLPAANFTDASDVLTAASNGTYQTVFVAANLPNATQIAYFFGNAGQDFNVRAGAGVQRSAPNGNDWSYNAVGTGAQYNWANGAQGTNVTPPTAVITSDQASSARTMTASVSNTFLNRGVIGQIGDVVTFNRALTTAERRTVEEYLGRKWGVNIVAPTVPTAPTITSTTFTSASNPGNANGTATLTWTPPINDGGSAVTGYVVNSSAGQTYTTTGATTYTVTGLRRNTNYTFTVTAVNAVGTGPASAASAVVRP